MSNPCRKRRRPRAARRPQRGTQVYQVFIKASPEEIWEAITTPEFTRKYFFGSHVTVTPERYTGLDGEGNDLVVGGVSEYEPPHRLVHEWRSLYDPKRRRRRPAACRGRSRARTAAPS